MVGGPLRSAFCSAAILALASAGCIENGFTPQTDGVDAPEETGVTDPVGDGSGDVDPYAGLGSVLGRICAPNGSTWVGGAMVWVEHESGLAKTFTDSEGWFLLEGVPPGIHTVRVQTTSLFTEFQVEVFPDFVTRLAEQECLGSEARIAVVTGVYDNIEMILGRLGFEADLIDGVKSDEFIQFLRDPGWLDDYEVIYLNCGMGEHWWTYRDEIGANLAQFVDAGGSIYASDMSYHALEAAFPAAVKWAGDEDVQFAANIVSGPVVLDAAVTDEAFAAALGKDTVKAVYAKDGLYAAGQRVDAGRVLFEATFSWYSWHTGASGTMTGPLGIRLDRNDGAMVWTSFHNEEQKPSEMDPLLEQIVLSL